MNYSASNRLCSHFATHNFLFLFLHVIVSPSKGDFPHAGVRNFPADSDEQRLMDQLIEKIAEINKRYPVHERVLRTKATVEMMANFPGLNKLCRLHCSTRMVKGGILIPDNSVGFDGCLPNDPDRRCFEDDVVEEDCESFEVKAKSTNGWSTESPLLGAFPSDTKRTNIVTPERKGMPRPLQERPSEDERFVIKADRYGNVFWKSVESKQVVVRTNLFGQTIASGVATLPTNCKKKEKSNKKHHIISVSREKDGKSSHRARARLMSFPHDCAFCSYFNILTLILLFFRNST